MINENATAMETMETPVVETEVTEATEVVETTEVTTDAAVESKVLVVPGKQGVTNTQLIPALKLAIDAKDLELAKEIVQTFPEVYAKSYKYFQKGYKAYLTENQLGI